MSNFQLLVEHARREKAEMDKSSHIHRSSHNQPLGYHIAALSSVYEVSMTAEQSAAIEQTSDLAKIKSILVGVE